MDKPVMIIFVWIKKNPLAALAIFLGAFTTVLLFAITIGWEPAWLEGLADRSNAFAELLALLVEATLIGVILGVVIPKQMSKVEKKRENQRYAPLRIEFLENLWSSYFIAMTNLWTSRFLSEHASPYWAVRLYSGEDGIRTVSSNVDIQNLENLIEQSSPILTPELRMLASSLVQRLVLLSVELGSLEYSVVYITQMANSNNEESRFQLPVKGAEKIYSTSILMGLPEGGEGKLLHSSIEGLFERGEWATKGYAAICSAETKLETEIFKERLESNLTGGFSTKALDPLKGHIILENR